MQRYSRKLCLENRSVGVLVMRDRTSKSLSRTAFPDSLLSPGRPASTTLCTRRLARLPQMTGRWQIAPIALTSGAYARRSCYRRAAYRGTTGLRSRSHWPAVKAPEQTWNSVFQAHLSLFEHGRLVPATVHNTHDNDFSAMLPKLASLSKLIQ